MARLRYHQTFRPRTIACRPLTSRARSSSRTSAPALAHDRTRCGHWPGRAVLVGGAGQAHGASRCLAPWATASARRGRRQAGTLALLSASRISLGAAHQPRPAPAALARPPQADPQLHLRRPGAGAAHHHLLPALRVAPVWHRQPVRRRHAARSGVEQAQFLARVHGAWSSAPSAVRRAEASAFLDRKQALLAERYPDASLPSCRSGATCDCRAAAAPTGLGSGRRARSSPGRGRTSSRRRQMPAWVPCGGFAGLVAYDDRHASRADGRAQRRAPASRRISPCAPRRLPTAPSPRFAIVLDLPVERARPRAGCDEDTGIELRDITICAAHRPRPQAARDRRARGAARAAAEDGRAGFKPPWFVVPRLRGLGDRTHAAGDAVDRDEHRRDLQPAVAARSSARCSFGQMLCSS